MEYTIVTICFGQYDRLLAHWLNHIYPHVGTNEGCVLGVRDIQIQYPNISYKRIQETIPLGEYGAWDYYRMMEGLEVLRKGRIFIHIDMDIVFNKSFKPLLELPYDIVFSREQNEENGFPLEPCQKIGFGLCSGFYIAKPYPRVYEFMTEITNTMLNRKYKSYSDQVTIMNMLADMNLNWKSETYILDENVYKNHSTTLSNGTTICILDLKIIPRYKRKNIGQIASHLHVCTEYVNQEGQVYIEDFPHCYLHPVEN
jgi:hypothetical protein